MKNLIITLSAVLLMSFNCAGPSNTETLTIASVQADCMGVGPQKCLLIKHDGNDSWEYLYTGISGFDYEPGYEYVITVSRVVIENPAADQSSFVYRLEEIKSKTRKDSANLPPAIPMRE